MTAPGRSVLTRVGLHIPASVASGASPSAGIARLSDIASSAEGSGFDSIWVSDTTVDAETGQVNGAAAGDPEGDQGGWPGSGPAREAYTVLGALATCTRSASLGAMVTPVTARNPAVLAKIVTGLDALSGGRAVLGIGPGGIGPGGIGPGGIGSGGITPGEPGEPGTPREPGAGLLDRPDQLDRLGEGLQICRAMFTEEAPTFEGRYYRIAHAHNRPRPIRPDGIPILVGGDDEGLLELAARYGDAVLLSVTGDLGRIRGQLATLDRACEQVGRDPAAISRIARGTLAIAPTGDAAARRLDRAAAHGGWSLDDRAGVTAGAPESVTDQVADLVGAGVDGVVFTMLDAGDLELVALAGEALRSPFD